MDLGVCRMGSDSSLPEAVCSLLQAMFFTSMNAIVRFGDTAIDSRNDSRRNEVSHMILNLLDALGMMRGCLYQIVTVEGYPIRH